MSLNRYIEKPPQDEPQSEPPPNDTLLPGATTRTPPKPTSSTEPGLLLRCANGGMWTFPWSYFIEAQFTGEPETLRIVFGNRKITLRGRNLAALMEPIARHHLWEVREVPEKYLSTADTQSSAPLVSAISVIEREK